MQQLADCLINSSALPANPYKILFFVDLCGCVRLLTQICLTLTTLNRSKMPLQLIKIKGKILKKMQSRFIRLIELVFSGSADELSK